MFVKHLEQYWVGSKYINTGHINKRQNKTITIIIFIIAQN